MYVLYRSPRSTQKSGHVIGWLVDYCFKA